MNGGIFNLVPNKSFNFSGGPDPDAGKNKVQVVQNGSSLLNQFCHIESMFFRAANLLAMNN